MTPAQANTTVSDDPMVTQAIRCDLWPEWLGELVDKAAGAYVDKYDMSTEQAVAYGILLALDARRATEDVTEASNSTSARFNRLYGICRRILWADASTPAMDNEQTKAAFDDLAEFMFMDGIDAALSQQAPE